MNFLKTIGLLAATTFVANYSYAEGQTTPFEVNGNLDFYYQLSPQGHAPVPATPSGPSVLDGRYFDRHTDEFTLNLAEISLKKKMERTQFKVSIGAGELVDQLSGGSSQSVSATNPTNTAANEPTRNILEATVSYQATDRLSFMAGKFFSPIGLEVTRAKENWQYSRSYLFNYGPFWHQGFTATYALVPDRVSTTLYVLNAWDGRISQEANRSTTLGANLNYTSDFGLTANYNYFGGSESAASGRRELHEVNGIYKITNNHSAGLDIQYASQTNAASVGTARWYGAAVYFKSAISDFYSISPRFEYFDDSDAGFAVVGGLASASAVRQRISAWTLTNSFDLKNGLEARIEFRFDKSDSDQFFRTKDGGPTKEQGSTTFAVLYSF